MSLPGYFDAAGEVAGKAKLGNPMAWKHPNVLGQRTLQQEPG